MRYETWPSAGVRWKGVDVLKQPGDLILQQELIWDTQPDVVVETGSKFGGSACFYGDLGVQVHSVDVAPPKTPAAHPSVTYYRGFSTDPRIVYQITRACEDRRVMVVLDSDHSKQTVLDELRVYAPMVTPGCYLIVEDTALGGPQEALDEWLPGQPFRILPVSGTEHPGGYLLRWN